MLSREIAVNARVDDPRLISPQCDSLMPVGTVHENPWFFVKNRGGYFTVEYKNPQVIILPIIENRSILMVRAKRPVIDDSSLELPAGSVKRHESPVSAAARELLEETGIKIENLDRFILKKPLSNSPNRSPILLHIFQISLLHKEFESRKFHDDEIEQVECLRFEDTKRMIVEGEIYVSVPMAIIGRFFLENDLKCLK